MVQRVSGIEVFNKARAYHKGKTEQGEAHERDLDQAEKLYNEVLNNNLGHPLVLYSLGVLHHTKGHVALAVQLLKDAVNQWPDFGEAWNDLGLCFRAIEMLDEADRCLANAEKHRPGLVDIPNNRAGLCVNRGMPEKVLEHAERALKIDPDFCHARWHKAAALLEMQRFEEAWEWHESRLEASIRNKNAKPRNYHGSGGETPVWDGKTKGFVAIHGEQGLGDEIMFASCIPDAVKTGADLLIEPSPRLHNLFKRSFPECKVHGTDKVDGLDWTGKHGRPDFKCAIGSLPRFWRRSLDEFPDHKGYLKADPKKARYWRKRLDRLGPRPKIGLGWQGGLRQTHVFFRSLWLRQLLPILSQDADFISVQYTPDAEKDCAQFNSEHGIRIHHWKKAAQAWDLDDQAALVANLDLVITVCQTLVHMSGALNVPCWVLTPSKPSWRYGVTGNMPWYGSVDLYRQQGDDWIGIINEAAAKLRELLAERKREEAA